MASTRTYLMWLTAMTTASLTVTGCTRTGATPSSQAEPRSRTSSHSSATDTGRLARPTPTPTVTETPSPVAAVLPAAPPRSVLVLSDGTDVVRVAGRPVRFPGPVTDATASPNGLDVAFVDGLGNIAVGSLDGSSVRVLTTTDPGVRRAQPSFEDGGSEIIFSERGHDGVWRLKEVAADGHDDLSSGRADPTLEETAADGGHDTAPNALWFQASHSETARSVLVFEHRTKAGRVQVYVADRNQRGFGANRLLPGRSPAVSPSGDRVAFIGAAGQLQVVSLTSDRRHPRQVTWGLHPTGHLAWSADGSRIAFSTDHDVEAVASTPGQAGSNPPHVVLGHPGVASYATVRRPVVGTYAGADPETAALAVSRARYADGSRIAMDETSGYGVTWADHVTLVSTADPDAAAAAAAVANGGPVLFVSDGRLDPQVRAEIVRLLHRPRGLRRGVSVDIVGTTAYVPDGVAAELRALGLRVRRFDPTNSAAVAARAADGRYSTYVVVSRDDLAAVVSSASTENHLLLTDGSTMPAETARKLDRMWHDPGEPATVYAVGAEAQAAVRSSWTGKRPFDIVDVGGADPFGTSLAAVRGLYDSPGRLTVTAAGDWQAQLIGTMAGPALVVDRSLSQDAQAWLAASQPVLRAVYVIGRAPSLATQTGHAVFGTGYRVVHTPADITR